MGKGSKEIFFSPKKKWNVPQVYKKVLNICISTGKANQTKMTYHLMPATMAIIKKKQEISVGKVVEKRETLCIVGGNINWWSYYGLKIELSYDTAIPLLGTYLKKKNIYINLWKRSMPLHGHCSTIYYNQDMVRKNLFSTTIE